MALNDIARTSRGITYPTGATRFPSQDWWKALAESTDAAIASAQWERRPLPETTDLDTIPAGVHLRVGSFSTEQHYPLSGSGTVAIEQLSSENTNGVQIATVVQATASSGTWYRRKVGSQWQPWRATSADPQSSGPLSVRTSIETDGSWTTRDQVWDYLRTLSGHPDASLVTIGKSYRGRDIPGIVIGNPDKPAFLAVGGQHGNEPGNTHGLLQWARDLLTYDDQILVDMCFLIVPLLNFDNWLTWRNNPVMDLNRDWIGFTQPETQAVRDWIKNYNVIGAVDGHSFGYNREVSSRVPTLGTEEVRRKSQALYDATGRRLQKEGQFFREYEWENKPGMMHEGMANLGIPAIITETPSGFGYESEDRQVRRIWQQKTSALAMDAAAREVWSWVSTYPNDLVKKNAVEGVFHDITSTLSIAPLSGTVHLHREGSVCTIYFNDARFPASRDQAFLIATLPEGWRPAFTQKSPMVRSDLLAQITQFGNVQFYPWSSEQTVSGPLRWVTAEPMPTSIPGK